MLQGRPENCLTCMAHTPGIVFNLHSIIVCACVSPIFSFGNRGEAIRK